MRNTVKQNKLIDEYIMNSIQVDEDMCAKDKLEALYDTFMSEYMNEYEMKRYGSVEKVFEQYTLGLPSVFEIHYEYYYIEKQLREWEIITDDMPSRKVEQLKMNWFNYIAHRVFKLMRKARVGV